MLVVTAWDPKLFVQNVNLLGQIFGTEDRAEELSDFYTEITSLLSTRLAGLTDADRPSVYFENGQASSRRPGIGLERHDPAGGRQEPVR